ncbi:MAG TPA: MOSC domain-containing protein [Baekduia sp.]|nr:MOSC domain-containing protein [Baekduia sp.]
MTTLAADVLSLRVGRPAALPWRGRDVRSAFVKAPVDGRVPAGPLGLAGDEQADLRVHGGPDKAICCYASEHLAGWNQRFGLELGPGAFGENLTLAGMTEDVVHIGDVVTVGTVTAQVSQPRGPCFKVAARWGRRELVAAMARELRAGFYLRVLEPGEIAAGDRLELVERVSEISVAEVLRVTYRDRHDPAALQAVLDVPELAAVWREDLETLRDRRQLPLADPLGDA